jgi:hypothetical protein
MNWSASLSIGAPPITLPRSAPFAMQKEQAKLVFIRHLYYRSRNNLQRAIRNGRCSFSAYFNVSDGSGSAGGG